jgi:hypothetical protein
MARRPKQAIMNVTGLPVILTVDFARRENQDLDLVGLISRSSDFQNPHNSDHMQFRLSDSLSSADLPCRQA